MTRNEIPHKTSIHRVDVVYTATGRPTHASAHIRALVHAENRLGTGKGAF